MSAQQDRIDEFRFAKENFLMKARNAKITDGFVEGLDDFDLELYHILQLGVHSGLSASSREILDMQDLATLVGNEQVSEADWHQIFGMNAEGLLPVSITTTPYSGPISQEHSIIETMASVTVNSNPGPSEVPTTSDPTLSAPSLSSPHFVPADDKEPRFEESAEPEPTPIDAERVPSPPPVPSNTPAGTSPIQEDTNLVLGPRIPSSRTTSVASEVVASHSVAAGPGIEPPATFPMKRKRVRLILKKQKGREDDTYQQSSGGSDRESENMDVDEVPPISKRKKRRIASSAMVVSDDDEQEEPRPSRVVKKKRLDGWKTIRSPKTCRHCGMGGYVCERFVMRPTGMPRFACPRCHDRKTMCDLAQARRTAYAQFGRFGNDLDEEVEEAESEEDVERVEKPRTKESRAGAQKMRKPTVDGRKRSQTKKAPKTKVSLEEYNTGDDEDSDEIQRGRQDKKKRKGKQRDRRDAPKRETSAGREGSVKSEDEDEDEEKPLWSTIQGNDAGPSTGLIRRPRETARDIADLYARIREAEMTTHGLSLATASTLQEIRGDVDRLGSDQATQKKFVLKELVRVEEIAQEAMEKSTGVQEQVDSVRQQTRDMHESLAAMNRHSDTMTAGLTEMMQGLRDLRVDMPNRFEDWCRVRFGPGGIPPMVSGADLQVQWNTQNPTPAGPSQSSAPGPLPNFSSPPRPSSMELFRSFVNPQSSSEDELVVKMGSRDDRPSGANQWEGSQALSADMHPPMEVDLEGSAPSQSSNNPSTPVPPANENLTMPTEPTPFLSPDAIRSVSVEPPVGLILTDRQLSPPSSQPALPSSPTPRPNERLLTVPDLRPVIQMGPITRSRSRSRSGSASIPDTTYPSSP